MCPIPILPESPYLADWNWDNEHIGMMRGVQSPDQRENCGVTRFGDVKFETC